MLHMCCTVYNGLLFVLLCPLEFIWQLSLYCSLFWQTSKADGQVKFWKDVTLCSCLLHNHCSYNSVRTSLVQWSVYLFCPLKMPQSIAHIWSWHNHLVTKLFLAEDFFFFWGLCILKDTDKSMKSRHFHAAPSILFFFQRPLKKRH